MEELYLLRASLTIVSIEMAQAPPQSTDRAEINLFHRFLSVWNKRKDVIKELGIND